jgi:hypothetical protein
MIDPRSFTGSIKTYILKNKPDIVIVMYEPGNIETPDYGTHLSTFDFR